MSFKIITTHPLGQRVFDDFDKMLRTAEAFGIELTEDNIVTTGDTLVAQRKG